MTLSPNTTTSNSPLEINRLRMLRLGLLRAFTSRAQTPMIPHGAGLTSSSFLGWRPLSLLGLWLLAAVLPLNLLLARLLSLVGSCDLGAPSPLCEAFRFAISDA